MKTEDHYMSLHLLKEGLSDADALKLFLIALAKAIQELDESGDYKDFEKRFLCLLDEILQDLHILGESPPRSVEATKIFRQVLNQHFSDLHVYLKRR